jgi:hypothetical protein
LGPNVAKERAGVVLDHPNDPRVTNATAQKATVYPLRETLN